MGLSSDRKSRKDRRGRGRAFQSALIPLAIMRAQFAKQPNESREAYPSADSANPPRLGLHPHSTLASGRRIFTPRNTVSRNALACDRTFSRRAVQSYITADASGERGSFVRRQTDAMGERGACVRREPPDLRRFDPRTVVIRPLRVLVCFTLLVRGLGRAQDWLARIRSPLTQGTRALYGISYPASFAP